MPEAPPEWLGRAAARRVEVARVELRALRAVPDQTRRVSVPPRGVPRPVPRRAIAVALHDVEPATFERCALIRDWLDDHGVDKVTLLVIPASDLHPFQDRRPEMVDWLADRVAAGDAIAQHGFQHRQARRSSRFGDRFRPQGEFDGLDEAETRRVVEAGRRVLRLAGVQPRGFVAPGYAYPAALRRVLATSFDWWAGRHSLSYDGGRASTRADVVTPGVRHLSALRAGGPLLRLDLHPVDLDHPGRIGACETVLRRARSRIALTYDELTV